MSTLTLSAIRDLGDEALGELIAQLPKKVRKGLLAKAKVKVSEPKPESAPEPSAKRANASKPETWGNEDLLRATPLYPSKNGMAGESLKEIFYAQRDAYQIIGRGFYAYATPSKSSNGIATKYGKAGKDNVIGCILHRQQKFSGKATKKTKTAKTNKTEAQPRPEKTLLVPAGFEIKENGRVKRLYVMDAIPANEPKADRKRTKALATSLASRYKHVRTANRMGLHMVVKAYTVDGMVYYVALPSAWTAKKYEPAIKFVLPNYSITWTQDGLALRKRHTVTLDNAKALRKAHKKLRKSLKKSGLRGTQLERELRTQFAKNTQKIGGEWTCGCRFPNSHCAWAKAGKQQLANIWE